MSEQQANENNKRRSTRKPKHRPQTSRSAMSENEAYASNTTEQNTGAEGKSNPRTRSHVKKNGHQSDAAVSSDGPTQQHRHDRVKATPIKSAAYAGATFQQSPAASALPMPSFYSKSVPSKPLMLAPADGSPPDSAGQDRPNTSSHEQREPTPLDWMFDAARKASATPGTASPQQRYHSPSGFGSPASRSPAPVREGAMFPFEMDSTEQESQTSTSSTPFKDRIAALTTTRSPPTSSHSMDEGERHAKAEALKNFLKNSAQAGEHSDGNPFNARSMPPGLVRHNSNPTLPYNNTGHQFIPQQMPWVQYGQPVRSPNPPLRAPSSGLRNIYEPGPSPIGSGPVELPSNQSSDEPRISTARTPGQQHPTERGAYMKTTFPPQAPSPAPTPQQLEDDLRRVLKLVPGGQG